MARKDKANIANGILCGVVTAAGIAFSILTQRVVQIVNGVTTRENGIDVRFNSVTAGLWATGLLFIIPGFVGIIASVIHMKGGKQNPLRAKWQNHDENSMNGSLQNSDDTRCSQKGSMDFATIHGFSCGSDAFRGLISRSLYMFVTQLVLSIIALAIWILSFATGFRSATVRSMFDSRTCHIVGSSCICDTAYLKSLSKLGFTCEETASATHAGVGTDAMFLIGGVVMLVTTVLAGRYCCCVREDQSGRLGNNTQQLADIQRQYVNNGYDAQPGYAAPPPSYEVVTEKRSAV